MCTREVAVSKRPSRATWDDTLGGLAQFGNPRMRKQLQHPYMNPSTMDASDLLYEQPPSTAQCGVLLPIFSKRGTSTAPVQRTMLPHFRASTRARPLLRLATTWPLAASSPVLPVTRNRRASKRRQSERALLAVERYKCLLRLPTYSSTCAFLENHSYSI